MTRLLVSGDWHIGAGAEYGRKPGDRLRDQADVCQQIATLAAERDVDGVLLAGDLLNGPAAAPEHLAVLAQFVEACPVDALTITGNGTHDLAMRDVNGLAIFEHVPGITVESRPEVHIFAGCAVATLPWVSPARLIAKRNGGDRDELHADVAAMLIDIARGLKEDCERVAPDLPHVLCAHWSVSGSSLPNGLPVDQLREPVIPLPELEQLGFDAVTLGHIHLGALLSGAPPILYVGTPMPLSFGEGHYEHGVWILSFDDDLGVMSPEFVPIDSPPFVTLERDLTVSDDETEWVDGLDFSAQHSRGELNDAIVRVKFKATAEQARVFDLAAARIKILDAGAAVVKIVPEIIRQDRARVSGLDEQVDELDALEQWMTANGLVGVDEPWELAEPTDVLADAMRAKTRGYLERV